VRSFNPFRTFKLMLFRKHYKIWICYIFISDKSFDIASRNHMSTFAILEFGIRALIGPGKYGICHRRLWRIFSR
jgi:hypothetical protein